MKFTDKLYKILEQSNEKADILLASNNHTVFKNHFPKNPILPAFLQIEIAKELFKIEITKIKKAKFINIIKAKERVSFINKNNKITIYSMQNNKLSEINYE